MRHSLVSAAVFCVFFCTGCGGPPPQPVPKKPSEKLSAQMPFDVASLPDPSVADWNEFGWQSFVASNWPVAGKRGVPDPSKDIGATDSEGMPLRVVWMTSKGPGDVFLPEGAEPDANWQSQVATTACEGLVGYDPATSYVLGMVSKTAPRAFSEIDQAAFPGSKKVIGPLIDQARRYVHYDIRMSRSEFQYFLTTKYYNSANQVNAVTSDPISFEAPPKGPEAYVQQLPEYARYGAVEYKASWRPLDPSIDIVSRYFTAKAFVVEPSADGHICKGPLLMGLTGLHILRLTPSTPATWFWSSFEQIDNLTVPDPPPIRPDGKPLTPSFNPGTGETYATGYSYMPDPVKAGSPLPDDPPVDVSRLTPVQPESASITAAYQKLLSGTVWEHYELVGVQFPVNPMYEGKAQGSGKGEGDCWVAGNNHENEDAYQLNDCFLANATMETYVQSTSCAACHSYGAPLGVPRNPRGRPSFDALDQFQIFSFMLLEAQPPVSP